MEQPIVLTEDRTSAEAFFRAPTVWERLAERAPPGMTLDRADLVSVAMRAPSGNLGVWIDKKQAIEVVADPKGTPITLFRSVPLSRSNVLRVDVFVPDLNPTRVQVALGFIAHWAPR